MATNNIYSPGERLSVVCTHPTTPTSGCPVRLGILTGVALADEGESITSETTVDFGPGVWDLSVKGVGDAGNVAVVAGDNLYYIDADINDGTGFLSKKTGGRFFGVALEGVDSGATTTIRVKHVPSGAPSAASLAAGFLKTAVVAGAAAGNVTVTGISAADELLAVIVLDRDATAANITLAQLTSEFTITAADTINNTGGTSTSGNALLVIWANRA